MIRVTILKAREAGTFAYGGIPEALLDCLLESTMTGRSKEIVFVGHPGNWRMLSSLKKGKSTFSDKIDAILNEKGLVTTHDQASS